MLVRITFLHSPSIGTAAEGDETGRGGTNSGRPAASGGRRLGACAELAPSGGWGLFVATSFIIGLAGSDAGNLGTAFAGGRPPTMTEATTAGQSWLAARRRRRAGVGFDDPVHGERVGYGMPSFWPRSTKWALCSEVDLIGPLNNWTLSRLTGPSHERPEPFSRIQRCRLR